MKKIAIQGIRGSFHDIAAHQYFAEDEVELICCDTFEQIFSEMRDDYSRLGLMAIENTIAGSLLHNYELLRESDVLSLSSPLTDQTRGLINKDALSKMKKTAFLINTSRGGLLVEQDVREALDAGVIAGAAVDVLSTEPPKADNPLIGAKNIVITPHIAWATTEARTRLLEIVRGNIAAWQAGNTQNRVN